MSPAETISWVRRRNCALPANGATASRPRLARKRHGSRTAGATSWRSSKTSDLSPSRSRAKRDAWLWAARLKVQRPAGTPELPLRVQDTPHHLGSPPPRTPINTASEHPVAQDSGLRVFARANGADPVALGGHLAFGGGHDRFDIASADEDHAVAVGQHMSSGSTCCPPMGTGCAKASARQAHVMSIGVAIIGVVFGSEGWRFEHVDSPIGGLRAACQGFDVKNPHPLSRKEAAHVRPLRFTSKRLDAGSLRAKAG